LKLTDVDKIIAEYQEDKSALIQILLRIQKGNGWLPQGVLLKLSRRLGVPLSQIYHIATFYKAFSLSPRGRHSVCVCMGTACHVRGAPRLLEKVMGALDIVPGQTSPDQKFTLNTVNCLGCCAMGPVMMVDGEYHGDPHPKEIRNIIARCD